MIAEPIIFALALPGETQVSQRVPKKLLLENGAPTSADKRGIQDGIDELVWVASLKPTNIGVPSYRDTDREYVEIAVLSATFRPEAKATRLIELIHRAIPYPVVLAAVQGNLATLSFGHKRWSQAQAGQTVAESMEITVPFCPQTPSPAESAFLASLALAHQAQQNLFALYQSWIDRVTALAAANVTGTFVLKDSPESAANRRRALADYAQIEGEMVALRAEAEGETQINRRVALNLGIKAHEMALAKLTTDL